MQQKARQQDRNEGVRRGDDRTLYAARVRHADVKKDVLQHRLEQTEQKHPSPGAALGRDQSLCLPARKEDRKHTRKRKAKPRKKQL